MNRVSDKLMEWLEQFDVKCGYCNEPFGCSDEIPNNISDEQKDYDAWIHNELAGIYHRGCATDALK